eukprot:5189087-Amphidinium_carterae.1
MTAQVSSKGEQKLTVRPTYSACHELKLILSAATSATSKLAGALGHSRVNFSLTSLADHERANSKVGPGKIIVSLDLASWPPGFHRQRHRLRLLGSLSCTPAIVSRPLWRAVHRTIHMRIGEMMLDGGVTQHGAIMGWSPHSDTMMHAALLAQTIIDFVPANDAYVAAIVEQIDDGQIRLEQVTIDDVRRTEYLEVGSHTELSLAPPDKAGTAIYIGPSVPSEVYELVDREVNVTAVSERLMDKLVAVYRTIDGELSESKTSMSAKKTIYLNRIIAHGQRSTKATHTLASALGLLWQSNFSPLERVDRCMAKMYSGLQVGSSVLYAVRLLSACVASPAYGTAESQILLRHLPATGDRRIGRSLGRQSMHG